MYSLHMRKNIIDIKANEKLSIREAARRFGISPNTVYKWGKKIEPKGWRKQRVSKIDIKKLEKKTLSGQRFKLQKALPIIGMFLALMFRTLLFYLTVG